MIKVICPLVVSLAKCLACLKSQNSESPPLCVRFPPLHRGRGYEMLIQSLVYDTLERSQCMFRSAALDTVISMQVLEGSRNLRLSESGSELGRRHTPQCWVALLLKGTHYVT